MTNAVLLEDKIILVKRWAYYWMGGGGRGKIFPSLNIRIFRVTQPFSQSW